VIQEIILFSLCRSLGRYKSLVRNRAAPEGSIVEGYFVDEMLTFCSRYLEYAPTIHNRPQRNLDEARGAITRVNLDQRTLTQVHRYIILTWTSSFNYASELYFFFKTSYFGLNIHL
jgi:hypothetical protein